ncbi:MAG TPA: DnaB-like helicase N-terminal domain-containing protein [Saprospiraceae bacterium]|jgi:replicative DNA helicase|nr:DnaB-like helicase N-terminal domain-containing protein [Saprospiraceae bacterium]
MQTNKRNTRVTRSSSDDVTSMIYGKIPPSSRDLEEAVIGSILIECDAYSEIANILKPESFYVEAHKTIYESIVALANNSEPIDLLTVTEHLRKRGKLEECGGAYYISELTNKVGSSANIEYHARIVSQKWMARELINVSNDIIRDCYEDTVDIFDVKDNFIIRVDAINNTIESGSVSTGLFVVNKIKQNLINPPDKPKHIEAILGIKHLLGTVDCYAAKPGTGKTEILLESALIEATKGNKVGILSLELKKDLLMSKMLHHYTGVFANKIIENDVHGEYLERILSKDYSVMNNIIIDDSSVTNVNMRSKIISLVKKFGCRSIWIDYIQLTQMIKLYQGQTDTAGMEQLMNALQRTAKELDVCIIPLSQLKRGTEKPTMEDIRGGGIEQSCSQIFLLEDPNMKANYGKSWNEIDFDRGKLEIINVKERFGDKGKMDAYYDKPRQIIMHWNDRDNNDIMSEMEQQQPAKQNFDIF